MQDVPAWALCSLLLFLPELPWPSRPSPGWGFAPMRTLLLWFEWLTRVLLYKMNSWTPNLPRHSLQLLLASHGLAKDIHTPAQCSLLGMTTPSGHALDHIRPKTKP